MWDPVQCKNEAPLLGSDEDVPEIGSKARNQGPFEYVPVRLLRKPALGVGYLCNREQLSYYLGFNARTY